jgi:hypothetical protein
MTVKPKLKKKVQKPIPGEYTLEMDTDTFWLFTVNGYLVTHVTFVQEEGTYTNLSVTLETGEVVNLEHTVVGRRGNAVEKPQPHEGIHPLMCGKQILPGEFTTVVDSCTLKTYNRKNAPSGAFFWEKFDLGMRDLTRAELARKIAATSHATDEAWLAYQIYDNKFFSDEDLVDLRYYQYAEIWSAEEARRRSKAKANPNGTDGWRW